MVFQTHNADVFLLSGPEVAALGPLDLSVSGAEKAGRVLTQVQYVPAGQSRAKVDLAWNPLPATRRERGEILDFTLTITRSGEASGSDLLSVRFPLQSTVTEERVFATVAAAAFRVSGGDALLGAEIGFGSAAGLAYAVPFVLGEVCYQASAFHYRDTSEPFFELRFHLRKFDGPITIHVGRIFAGPHYDPYIYNPLYEFYAHDRGRPSVPGAQEVIAQFESDAKEASKTHTYLGMQSFIHPFIVQRVGQPSFPMLIGTPNSMSWYGLDPRHGIEMYANQGFIRPGDVTLDCGAHAGQMSTYFGLISGPAGRVIAFDPFPQNYFQIEAQGRLNKLSNFVSARAGVAEVRRPMTVSINGQAIWAQGRASDEMEVPLVPLDDYIDERPTFIKLDIEGAEIFALQGAQRLMRTCRPRIFVEVHTPFLPNFGQSLADLFAAIPQEIYNVRVIVEGAESEWRPLDSARDAQVTVPMLLRAEPK